jgi:adenylyl- and sulfurtransferase ThiI
VDRFFVIHYNELGLKKGNRDFFENMLCVNINTVLEGCGAQRIKRISGGSVPRSDGRKHQEIKRGSLECLELLTLLRHGLLHRLWKS